ncbi:MAG: hypothetical protein M3277_00840 [Actinomycetota bacterium]|nr:hypothetical protein [Actinomycetota bacterium]
MPEHVKKRSEYESYNYISYSSDDGVRHNVLAPVEFETKKTEQWAAIIVHDNSDRPVPAEVGQDLDDDGELDETWRICGESESPHPIEPDRSLYVSVQVGDCGGTASPATSGTIQVDLFSPSSPRPALGDVEKVERVVTTAYTGWMLFEEADGSVSGGASRTQALASERFVRATVSEETGLPVHFWVRADDELGQEFCGETEKPVSIPKGAEVFVWLDPAPCPDGSPSVATRGTIELTFSNVR